MAAAETVHAGTVGSQALALLHEVLQRDAIVGALNLLGVTGFDTEPAWTAAPQRQAAGTHKSYSVTKRRNSYFYYGVSTRDTPCHHDAFRLFVTNSHHVACSGSERGVTRYSEIPQPLAAQQPPQNQPVP